MIRRRLNPRRQPGADEPGANGVGARALAEAVHAGEILLIEATNGSRNLVSEVVRVLTTTLREEPHLGLHEFPLLAEGRRAVETTALVATLAAAVFRDLGFPDDARMDQPRLRFVPFGAEKVPAAESMFTAHRDTWYACPQAQINAWVPLHDLPESQSFVFYPDFFDNPIPNTSADFEFQSWMERIGWHGKATLADYPRPIGALLRAGETVKGVGVPRPTVDLRFSARAGDIVLFAGHHLHQTRPNPIAGTTRFSIDFRLVPPWPGAPPSVDDASQGATERIEAEYHPLATWR